MKDIYNNILELAKSIKAQNLFSASKEIQGIRLFKNVTNFSRIQEFYLSALYMFDLINRDIVIDNISEKVLDDKIYWDSYMLWRRKKKYNSQEENKDKVRDLKLVAGHTITFPTKEE